MGIDDAGQSGRTGCPDCHELAEFFRRELSMRHFVAGAIRGAVNCDFHRGRRGLLQREVQTPVALEQHFTCRFSAVYSRQFPCERNC